MNTIFMRRVVGVAAAALLAMTAQSSQAVASYVTANELPVIIHNRPPVTGLDYNGQVYIPATAVSDAFHLASQPTASGLRLSYMAEPPLILTAHDPLGTWLGGQDWHYERSPQIVIDPATGVPKTIKWFGTYFYPVDIALYGLERYSQWVATGNADTLTMAKGVGNWLVSYQDARGGFPVPFDYDYRHGVVTTLRAGWVSGMAQGMASDLLAKLWKVTGNDRYRAAAIKSLDVLSTPVEQGGVLRKYDGSYEWWEEYPNNLPTYVLNGFIFALIGVYDTAAILHDDRAQGMYERGLRSLQRMVNLYDLGNRTSYDLLHHAAPGIPPEVARWDYHSTHVMLLSAMNIITGGEFASIQRRWLGYLNGVPTPDN